MAIKIEIIDVMNLLYASSKSEVETMGDYRASPSLSGGIMRQDLLQTRIRFGNLRGKAFLTKNQLGKRNRMSSPTKNDFSLQLAKPQSIKS